MMRLVMDEDDIDNDLLFSNKLRFLNVFLVLTIVSGHVSWYCNGEDWLTDIFRKSTMGTMGWFFFSSAFWYFKNYAPNVFVKKFVSRIKTLFIPYIIFNLIAVIFNFDKLVIQPVGITQKISSVIRCFIFCECQGVDILPLDNPTWYIIRLLTYFLVSPVVYFLLKNRCIGVISLISIFYFTLEGQYYWFNGFLFVFCLGAFISMHFKDDFVSILTKYTIQSNTVIGLFLFLLSYGLISFLLIKIFAVYPPMMAMNTMVQFLVSAICISMANVPKLNSKWGGGTRSWSFVDILYG